MPQPGRRIRFGLSIEIGVNIMQLQTNLQRSTGRNRFNVTLLMVCLTFAIASSLMTGALAAPKAAGSRTWVPFTNKLTVMTFNIRHAKGLDGQVRLQPVRDAIQMGNPDLVALQEVDRFQERSGFQDQAQALARSLKMTSIYAPAIRQGISQYGIALLSRYPLKNPHSYPLSGQKEPRVVLTSEIELQGEHSSEPGHEKQIVTVVTTHLGVSPADREQQVPELVRIVKKIRTPILFMGDLNMSDDDPLMKELNALLRQAPLPPSQPTVLHGGQIDHIFTSFHGVTGSPAWTEPTRASDHVPVMQQVVFNDSLK